MLIYVMTLGESVSLEEFLKKVIQLEWFGTPTSSSLSLFLELGIKQSVVYDRYVQQRLRVWRQGTCIRYGSLIVDE